MEGLKGGDVKTAIYSPPFVSQVLLPQVLQDQSRVTHLDFHHVFLHPSDRFSRAPADG